MTVTSDSESRRAGGWRDRFRRCRLLLAATAVVLAGLWAAGALAGCRRSRLSS